MGIRDAFRRANQTVAEARAEAGLSRAATARTKATAANAAETTAPKRTPKGLR